MKEKNIYVRNGYDKEHAERIQYWPMAPLRDERRRLYDYVQCNIRKGRGLQTAFAIFAFDTRALHTNLLSTPGHPVSVQAFECTHCTHKLTLTKLLNY